MSAHHSYLCAMLSVLVIPAASAGFQNSSSLTETHTNITTSEVPFVNATLSDGVSGEILINEVELNPEGNDSGREWIEVYNPGEVVAYTEGLTFNASGSLLQNVPENVTISPGGVYVVLLDNASLSNIVERISLVNSTSGETIDSTPPLVDNRDDELTWQRVPDGEDEWHFHDSTTGSLNSPVTEEIDKQRRNGDDTTQECLGSAGCVRGTAVRIVDSDTMYVSSAGEVYKIDLALIRSLPESDPLYSDATMFTRSLCLGSPVLVDQDDRQLALGGSVIADVYCASYGLNEALLSNGLATIDLNQCSTSEFQSSRWAEDQGCKD